MTPIGMYALEAAIQAEKPVMITYVAVDGEQTTRTIEPYEIATTQAGHLIVRSMDRRSGQPRSFRLDRITYLTTRPGPFTLARPAHHAPVVMPDILVRYHGSKPVHHGVKRLLGICGCGKCADTGVRYRLAEPGSHECTIRCVRPESVSAMSDQETAAYRAEQDQADAALARIRAEIAEISPYGYGRDAARWTPDEDLSPYAR